MRYLALFFLILILVIPVDGKLVIGNDTYIKTANELPYFSGIPEIIWQNNGVFSGWIDIVGWKNLTRRGDMFYVYGSPVDLVIVSGDASGESPDGDIISLEKTIVKTKSENRMVVSLIVTMTYFRTCSDEYGIFNCGRKSATAIFQDTENIPQQIETNDSPIKIIKTKYNFSELNRTYLEVEFNKNLYDRYNYSTQYGFFEHIYRSWHIENTKKGVYYANETIIDSINSINITWARDTIEVGSDQTPYTVTASGFYTTTNQSNESYVIRELDSSNQFSPYLIGVFLILFVMYKYCKIIITRRF